jgi:hypothetical protein
MSLTTFLDALAALERPGTTITPRHGTGAAIEITDPAEREGMLELLAAHGLTPSSDTRYYLHIDSPSSYHGSTLTITSHAAGQQIGLAVAETLLSWQARPGVVDVPGSPGDFANWPGLLQLLNPPWETTRDDDATIREIGRELSRQASAAANDGPFGSSLEPSSPAAALLGVLIADTLPPLVPYDVRFGLGTRRAADWAALVDVAHAETRLATREAAGVEEPVAQEAAKTRRVRRIPDPDSQAQPGRDAAPGA